jgi:hypothetical protein
MKIFLNLSFLLMLTLFSTKSISQNNKYIKQKCYACKGLKKVRIKIDCTNCRYWTYKDRYRHCQMCGGTKLIPEIIECNICEGEGFIMKSIAQINYEKSIISNYNKTKERSKVDVSKFACIINSNTNGKNLKQTKDNPEAYSFFKEDGSEFTFWDNGDFTYWDGDAQAIGKWKCVGGNNFEAYIEWGNTKHYYRSVTNQWALTPNAKKIN